MLSEILLLLSAIQNAERPAELFWRAVHRRRRSLRREPWGAGISAFHPNAFRPSYLKIPAFPVLLVYEFIEIRPIGDPEIFRVPMRSFAFVQLVGEHAEIRHFGKRTGIVEIRFREIERLNPMVSRTDCGIEPGWTPGGTPPSHG